MWVFFVRPSVVSFVAFVLSLFVGYIPFFWYLGKMCFVTVAFPEYLH